MMLVEVVISALVATAEPCNQKEKEEKVPCEACLFEDKHKVVLEETVESKYQKRKR